MRYKDPLHRSLPSVTYIYCCSWIIYSMYCFMEYRRLVTTHQYFLITSSRRSSMVSMAGCFRGGPRFKSWQVWVYELTGLVKKNLWDWDSIPPLLQQWLTANSANHYATLVVYRSHIIRLNLLCVKDHS